MARGRKNFTPFRAQSHQLLPGKVTAEREKKYSVERRPAMPLLCPRYQLTDARKGGSRSKTPKSSIGLGPSVWAEGKGGGRLTVKRRMPFRGRGPTPTAAILSQFNFRTAGIISCTPYPTLLVQPLQRSNSKTGTLGFNALSFNRPAKRRKM